MKKISLANMKNEIDKKIFFLNSNELRKYYRLIIKNKIMKI